MKQNKNEGDFIYFRDLITDGGIILDIGANIGVMLVHLARTHPYSRIIAFEPMPYNIRALLRVIGYYKLNNVELITTALGNSIGEVDMVMPVKKSARLQGLSHVIHDSITEWNEGEKFTAPLTTLDTFIEVNKITSKITAIKLDVENFEYFVLEGARKTLAVHHPIVYCELWENENRVKCFDLMKECNYKIMILRNKKLCKFEAGYHKTQNFFFVPVS
ncbi:MAG: FkbM family methyltransferase [Bacteroidota bacterium]